MQKGNTKLRTPVLPPQQLERHHVQQPGSLTFEAKAWQLAPGPEVLKFKGFRISVSSSGFSSFPPAWLIQGSTFSI